MPRYKRRPTLKTLITSQEDCPIDIPKKEYLAITEGFMQFIANKLLDGQEVNLPVKQGTLMIAGRKQSIKVDEDGKIRGAATNWKETLALWKRKPETKLAKKRIYHFNEHTNGVRYKFFWLNGYANLKNKHMMIFLASRRNSRSLWKRILDHVEYKLLRPHVTKT